MPARLARSYPRSMRCRRWRARSSGLEYLSVETFSPTSDSGRAAVGGWQKVSTGERLESLSRNNVVRGIDRLHNDLNCDDGDVKPRQNKQIIVK